MCNHDAMMLWYVVIMNMSNGRGCDPVVISCEIFASSKMSVLSTKRIFLFVLRCRSTGYFDVIVTGIREVK